MSRHGPPTRRRRPGQGAPSDSTTTKQLVDVQGTPRLATWTTTTRYQLTADPDGTLRAASLPRLRVAFAGECVRIELRGVLHFTGDAAATVGRALACASTVDVVGGRPGVAQQFREYAHDAARLYVRSIGGAA